MVASRQERKGLLAKPAKADLFGRYLRSELRPKFTTDTRFVVPIISEHYARKQWPLWELWHAKREAKRRSREFILQVRLDDVRPPLLSPDLAYLDLRKEGLFSVAEAIATKVQRHRPERLVPVPQRWVATFGLIVKDALESLELPATVPRHYVYVCDWLEEDLRARLSASALRDISFTEDHRDGEVLSVRVAFQWDSDKEPLDFGDIAWWEVLELDQFDRVYPDPP